MFVSHVICAAVGDDSQVVRNAALFAIGQFAEFLQVNSAHSPTHLPRHLTAHTPSPLTPSQPEISEYSGQLMPVLFQFLDQAISSEQQAKQSSSITKIFYALESFIEQLGCGLDPYLPTLMDKLFLALSLTKVRRQGDL